MDNDIYYAVLLYMGVQMYKAKHLYMMSRKFFKPMTNISTTRYLSFIINGKKWVKMHKTVFPKFYEIIFLDCCECSHFAFLYCGKKWGKMPCKNFPFLQLFKLFGRFKYSFAIFLCNRDKGDCMDKLVWGTDALKGDIPSFPKFLVKTLEAKNDELITKHISIDKDTYRIIMYFKFKEKSSRKAYTTLLLAGLKRFLSEFNFSIKLYNIKMVMGFCTGVDYSVDYSVESGKRDYIMRMLPQVSDIVDSIVAFVDFPSSYVIDTLLKGGVAVYNDFSQEVYSLYPAYGHKEGVFISSLTVNHFENAYNERKKKFKVVFEEIENHLKSYYICNKEKIKEKDELLYQWCKERWENEVD